MPIMHRNRTDQAAPVKVIESLAPLYKHLTDPPQFIATVDGQPLDLTPEQLCSFLSFRRRCQVALGFTPKLSSEIQLQGYSNRWDVLLQRALDSVITIPLPIEEASHVVREWLLQCRTKCATTMEEFEQGMPTVVEREGRLLVAFSGITASELITARFPRFGQNDVRHLLDSLGVERGGFTLPDGNWTGAVFLPMDQLIPARDIPEAGVE